MTNTEPLLLRDMQGYVPVSLCSHGHPLVSTDHELLIAKFRFKLKKVGKITRPFSYDINKIPYNYTVEVTNRFKGIDLIECQKNYGWRFVTLCRKK